MSGFPHAKAGGGGVSLSLKFIFKRSLGGMPPVLPPCPPLLLNPMQEVSIARDHYQTLGLLPNAEESEISKAFHARALALHPDKCAHPAATDMFQKAQEVISWKNCTDA